ncbi:MAG: inner membrane protein YiaA [Chloroflexota bacterium]
MTQKPTQAFVMAAWAALGVGILTYMIGLWNASISLSEKGFYLTILLFGLFGAVSVQKNVRDQLEGVPVTTIYYGISWAATILPILLLIIGLFNAEMLLSEKGFYGVAFVLSLFASVVVQKNTRDAEVAEVDLKHSI